MPTKGNTKEKDNQRIDKSAEQCCLNRIVRFYSAAIPVLLFCFSYGVGYFHLDALRTNRSAVTNIESLYGPAVMLAYGYGFISADVMAYPELDDFLAGRREALSPEFFEPPIRLESPSYVAEYHRYLL